MQGIIVLFYVSNLYISKSWSIIVAKILLRHLIRHVISHIISLFHIYFLPLIFLNIKYKNTFLKISNIKIYWLYKFILGGFNFTYPSTLILML